MNTLKLSGQFFAGLAIELVGIGALIASRFALPEDTKIYGQAFGFFVMFVGSFLLIQGLKKSKATPTVQ